MLKNVICDMGNVLMTWNPRELAEVGSSDPGDAAIFEKELFTSKEWPLNDCGLYSEDELFASVAKRIPERLMDRFNWLTKNWHEYMKPFPGACDFLRYIKSKGLKVYMLSNAPARFPDCVKKQEFFSLLDGAIVSNHVKAAKPDPKIFKIALEQFQIKAEESIFLDDIAKNVEGAQSVGITGYVFDGDFEKLKLYLRDLGV